MKKLIILGLLLIPTFANANELFQTSIDWYKIKTIKLVKNTWYKLIVGVSEKWESLQSMINRYGWVSGINWAYFCPKDYKECGWVNKTWSDRISNGYNWSTTPDDTGPDRVIFSLDKNQNPFLFQAAHNYSKWRNDEFITGKIINFDKKSDIYNWIGNYPLLLKDWINKLWESSLIDNKMKSKGLKNFVCSSKDGNIIHMWWIENISIYQVPDVLTKLWCYNAINLDSGWSNAMMYNNKYIRWPWRDIMDALIIIPDKNYPYKNPFSQNSKILSEVEKFKKILDKEIALLDDFTRKQKISSLSTKFQKMLSQKLISKTKKELYTALKKLVDSYLQ